MAETVVKIIARADGKRRVLIVTNNAAFSFREEVWSEEPLEMGWLRCRQQMTTICGSAEEAEHEARGRIAWLSER